MIGHITGHLGINHNHRDCENRHLPHHNHHHLGIQINHHNHHNTYPEHDFLDSNDSHGPTSNFPKQKEDNFGFPSHRPPLIPHFNHPKFSFDGNNGFHKDKPDRQHEIHMSTGEHHTTIIDDNKKFETKTPVVFPPFHEENSKDDPVSDFDRNEKNKNNVGSTVDLESVFSGSENDRRKGASGSRDWVVDTDDDIDDNTESGEIPQTHQIDIRFRKD